MVTVTAVVSLAVPLKDGVVLFDGETGCSSVTTGGSMPTVNASEGVMLIWRRPPSSGCSEVIGASGRDSIIVAADTAATDTAPSATATATSSRRHTLRALDRDFTCTTPPIEV